MMAVKVKELFGIIPEFKYLGSESVFTYNDELYMPLIEAYNWYGVCYEWIEDIEL
jgi:hypothetical protein